MVCSVWWCIIASHVAAAGATVPAEGGRERRQREWRAGAGRQAGPAAHGVQGRHRHRERGP